MLCFSPNLSRTYYLHPLHFFFFLPPQAIVNSPPFLCYYWSIFILLVTADGYVSAFGTTTAPNGFISISGTVGLRVTQPFQTTGLNNYLVCSKGSNIAVYYNNIDITELKFVYTVGAVPTA